MTPHLSYAYDEDDEFLHPIEGWLLLDRAIAYDSWITWRHALPPERESRNSMTPQVCAVIHTLAEALHDIHQSMPGYEDLGQSPLVVPRWWDPEADDEWSTGRCCLFRVEGFRSGEVIHHWREEDGVIALVMASPHHLEATLLIEASSDPAVFRSSSRNGKRRRSTSGRRRPQSPPPETPAAGPPAPAPARC